MLIKRKLDSNALLNYNLASLSAQIHNYNSMHTLQSELLVHLF